MKQYKKLTKKYPRSQHNIDSVIDDLVEGKLPGAEYSNLGSPPGKAVFKVRIANVDAGKGKSHGFRLIYYALLEDGSIILMAIYPKSDIQNIPQSLIKEMLRDIGD